MKSTLNSKSDARDSVIGFYGIFSMLLVFLFSFPLA